MRGGIFRSEGREEDDGVREEKEEFVVLDATRPMLTHGRKRGYRIKGNHEVELFDMCVVLAGVDEDPQRDHARRDSFWLAQIKEVDEMAETFMLAWYECDREFGTYKPRLQAGAHGRPVAHIDQTDWASCMFYFKALSHDGRIPADVVVLIRSAIGKCM